MIQWFEILNLIEKRKLKHLYLDAQRQTQGNNTTLCNEFFIFWQTRQSNVISDESGI